MSMSKSVRVSFKVKGTTDSGHVLKIRKDIPALYVIFQLFIHLATYTHLLSLLKVVLIRISHMKIAPTVVSNTVTTTGGVSIKPSKTSKQQKLSSISAPNPAFNESKTSHSVTATTSAAGKSTVLNNLRMPIRLYCFKLDFMNH